ncbi:hypothetical protein DdX_10630 [Ditylenchus destructor]|uniref:Uncharacterized protein n=1 Tax=Ditylenchus destructor TaxID=166010 RepID=A0AAD4R5D3_9BILA|nr:hypothetical protein DdX_10630 [Ditylenchus destructor]
MVTSMKCLITVILLALPVSIIGVKVGGSFSFVIPDKEQTEKLVISILLAPILKTGKPNWDEAKVVNVSDSAGEKSQYNFDFDSAVKQFAWGIKITGVNFQIMDVNSSTVNLYYLCCSAKIEI